MTNPEPKVRERCGLCEEVLASLDGGQVESLREWYEAGNHVCMLDCEYCARIIADQTDPILRATLLEGVKHGHIHMQSSQSVQMTGHLINKAQQIGELGERKNAAYGDSAARYQSFLSLLWPNGIPPASYRDAGLALRVFDKLMRVATNNDPDGENPWDDAAGYALIGAAQKR